MYIDLKENLFKIDRNNLCIEYIVCIVIFGLLYIIVVSVMD